MIFDKNLHALLSNIFKDTAYKGFSGTYPPTPFNGPKMINAHYP